MGGEGAQGGGGDGMEDAMIFVVATCAACGAKCTDHLTVNRDGPGIGPVVAVCETCAPCGRPLEEIWAAIAERQPQSAPKQLELLLR